MYDPPAQGYLEHPLPASSWSILPTQPPVNAAAGPGLTKDRECEEGGYSGRWSRYTTGAVDDVARSTKVMHGDGDKECDEEGPQYDSAVYMPASSSCGGRHGAADPRCDHRLVVDGDGERSQEVKLPMQTQTDVYTTISEVAEEKGCWPQAEQGIFNAGLARSDASGKRDVKEVGERDRPIVLIRSGNMGRSDTDTLLAGDKRAWMCRRSFKPRDRRQGWGLLADGKGLQRCCLTKMATASYGREGLYLRRRTGARTIDEINGMCEPVPEFGSVPRNRRKALHGCERRLEKRLCRPYQRLSWLSASSTPTRAFHSDDYAGFNRLKGEEAVEERIFEGLRVIQDESVGRRAGIGSCRRWSSQESHASRRYPPVPNVHLKSISLCPLNPSMTRSSELRSQITEAETRIADLVRQLAELRTHKTQLEAELRAIVYPILSIPAEITAEILYHAASHSETEWLLAATGVCRLWRNIALSTPRLWTEFYSDPWCRILTHLKDRGPLLQLWLSRSGSLPLNLAVHVGLDGERILASLAKHISRWRRVNLHEGSQCCHGALDRGQPRPSLALHGDVPLPDVDATCCPKWRSLVFCESSVVPGALLPMLANVTHLTLDRVDPAVVSKILLYATAVENLSVQSSRLEFPIVLPLVHTLHYHDGAPGLLDHSNLPALANLHIICRHSYPAAEAVKGFLTRSGCTLQLVHVENCRLNGLLDFLRLRLSNVR
ncbi:hypothetical protein C8F01DRAFT_1237095 [Mycena amicta]|nr:hypothetical protein C8F01DRAFT_1237095 [Mycena amicta]